MSEPVKWRWRRDFWSELARRLGVESFSDDAQVAVTARNLVREQAEELLTAAAEREAALTREVEVARAELDRRGKLLDEAVALERERGEIKELHDGILAAEYKRGGEEMRAERDAHAADAEALRVEFGRLCDEVRSLARENAELRAEVERRQRQMGLDSQQIAEGEVAAHALMRERDEARLLADGYREQELAGEGADEMRGEYDRRIEELEAEQDRARRLEENLRRDLVAESARVAECDQRIKSLAAYAIELSMHVPIAWLNDQRLKTLRAAAGDPRHHGPRPAAIAASLPSTRTRTKEEAKTTSPLPGTPVAGDAGNVAVQPAAVEARALHEEGTDAE